MKFVWQISYPPVNGSSLGSYLVKNGLFVVTPPNNNNIRRREQQTDFKLLPQHHARPR